MKYTNIETINKAENFCKLKMRKGAYEWLASGAEDNFTANKNIKDLNSLKLIPRILQKNRNKINFSKKFFKKNLNFPIILSPMGHQSQFHKSGEIEMAKGVSLANSIASFSTQGRFDLYDIRKSNPNLPLTWTIFLFGNKKWIKDEIVRAEKNNSIAIVLCLDASVRSHRYMDRETGYDARKFGKRTLKLPPDPSMDLSYDWEIVRWIKNQTKLPLILKGIISEDDAKLCLKYNVDGIWVSNHGGRMFNSGISSVEAIIKIKKIVKKNLLLIVDGGIRRGSDIIKYLCLGADLVGIGRPAIFGLFLNGKNGVHDIFEILKSEFYSACINGGFIKQSDFSYKRVIIPKTFS